MIVNLQIRTLAPILRSRVLNISHVILVVYQEIRLLLIGQYFIVIRNTTYSVPSDTKYRLGILLLRVYVQEINLFARFERVVLGLLHVELLEEFDGFLGCGSYRLITVYPALIKKLEQLVLVTQDLATKMCTQRINGINRDSFCVWVLRFLYLIDEDRQELVVVEAELVLDVEDN